MRKTKIVCTIGPACNNFEGGKVILNTGDTFSFTTEEIQGEGKRVSGNTNLIKVETV